MSQEKRLSFSWLKALPLFGIAGAVISIGSAIFTYQQVQVGKE